MRFFIPLVLAGLSHAACGSSPSAIESSSRLVEAPIANFRPVRPGLLYRGGHPDAAGLQYLKDSGITTIVDLEVADLVEATPEDIKSEKAEAERLGLELLHFPMSAFEPALSDRFDKQIDAIMSVFRAEAEKAPEEAKKIYVHCKHGEDRTGLVIGLERVQVEGWGPQVAHDEMVELGFHSGFIGLDGYFRRETGLKGD